MDGSIADMARLTDRLSGHLQPSVRKRSRGLEVGVEVMVMVMVVVGQSRGRLDDGNA